MKFVYVGPLVGPVNLPTLGLSVEPGEEFEATGEAAEGLLAQPDQYERTDKPVSRKSTDSEES